MAPKRDPEGTQIDAKIVFFLEPNFGTNFGAKKGDRGVRIQAEPGPGGTLLDHESIILRYLEV